VRLQQGPVVTADVRGLVLVVDERLRPLVCRGKGRISRRASTSRPEPPPRRTATRPLTFFRRLDGRLLEEARASRTGVVPSGLGRLLLLLGETLVVRPELALAREISRAGDDRVQGRPRRQVVRIEVELQRRAWKGRQVSGKRLEEKCERPV
jgi:hypothetical protein